MPRSHSPAIAVIFGGGVSGFEPHAAKTAGLLRAVAFYGGCKNPLSERIREFKLEIKNLR